MLRLFIALIMLLALAVQAEVQVNNTEIAYFNSLDNDTAKRVAAVARLSGDGKKLVYTEIIDGFDLSLSGWLGSCDRGWTDSNAAKVYLFDIASGSRSLLYQGKFSTATVNSQTCLHSIEAGFSADINYDGSQVALVFSSVAFNGDRSFADNTLRVVSINTQSQTLTDIAQLRSPGFIPESTPIKLSADGSTLVLAYEPAADTTTSTWGVEYYLTSNLRKLMAVPLRAGSSPVLLNHQVVAENGTEEELINFIGSEYHWFFDISDDGTRVVFQADSNGKVIGVNSDGSNYHLIAQIFAGAAFVSISGDGNHVAYADRESTEATLYLDSFDGGAAKSVVDGSDAYAAGNLILNSDGSGLFFNTYVASPGYSYGFTASSYYIATDGSQPRTALNYELNDLSDDGTYILTGMYGSPRRHLSQLSVVQQAEFDFDTGILSIPVVALKSSVFGDLHIAYALTLSITPNVDFQLLSVEAVTYNAAKINATYVMETGVLDMPAVVVADTPYAVTLRAVDFASLLFGLVSIQ